MLHLMGRIQIMYFKLLVSCFLFSESLSYWGMFAHLYKVLHFEHALCGTLHWKPWPVYYMNTNFEVSVKIKNWFYVLSTVCVTFLYLKRDDLIFFKQFLNLKKYIYATVKSGRSWNVFVNTQRSFTNNNQLKNC